MAGAASRTVMRLGTVPDVLPQYFIRRIYLVGRSTLWTSLKTVPHSAKEAAQILHDALVGTGLTIATAESLTGGDVGGTICTVAGASEYYRGGVISYASAVKASVLGVNGGAFS